jgi:hypothetical protein
VNKIVKPLCHNSFVRINYILYFEKNFFTVYKKHGLEMARASKVADPPSQPSAKGAKAKRPESQQRVLEIVVFGLLGFTSSHGWANVIDRLLNRIKNPNWQLAGYVAYAITVTSIFVALIWVTFDDNPNNDVFKAVA